MFFYILATVTLIYLFHQLYWKRRNLPPGPLPIPLIGNIQLLAKYEPGYELWKDLEKKYGPVFTFWLGNRPMVIVTDYEIIKETVIKDGNSYTGRLATGFSTLLRGGRYGLVEAFGDLWRQQRRFVLHVLRNFGMGQNLMEEKVVEQSRIFTEMLQKEAIKGPVDLQDHFDAAVGSIINTALVGYGYNEENMEEFKRVKNLLKKHMTITGHPSTFLLYIFPSLRKFPYLKTTFDGVKHTCDSIFDIFSRQKEEHEKTIDYDDDGYSDYMEAFLKERKKHENEEDFGGFSLPQLYNACFDLWMAGMETTSNTLYWGVLYTLTNPHVHKKIVEELDQVINSTRPVVMSDKPQLNYINATICEIQRLANVLPMNVARTTNYDVVVGDFKLPADTVIIPQISSILYNEELFPDPYCFNPPNFLNEDGSLKKIEQFVPFSVGKRQCPGEGLAKMELFLIYANFFNQFKVSLSPENANPTIEKKFGSTMKAKNFDVVLEKRINNEM